MSGYNDSIIRAVRADAAARRRLMERCAPFLPFGFDEGEREELTVNDLAEKVLKKLGLPTPRNGNHLEAINSWLAGRETASDRIRGVRSSMDAAEMPDWFHRYIA